MHKCWLFVCLQAECENLEVIQFAPVVGIHVQAFIQEAWQPTPMLCLCLHVQADLDNLAVICQLGQSLHGETISHRDPQNASGPPARERQGLGLQGPALLQWLHDRLQDANTSATPILQVQPCPWHLAGACGASCGYLQGRVCGHSQFSASSGSLQWRV